MSEDFIPRRVLGQQILLMLLKMTCFKPILESL
jgi:hypothetical protein